VTPRRSSSIVRQNELISAIENTPRPDLPDEWMAAEAARVASNIIKTNPKLRGNELLAALRKAEEDVLIG
jgi:hypothetical protein